MQKLNLKICVLGENCVGKTALIRRYLENEFKNDYRPTLGVDIYKKKIKTDDKEHFLLFWEIPLRERFKDLIKIYFNNTIGGIFVYDTTNKKSLYNLEKWLKRIEKYSESKIHTIPIILIGNKVDLKNERIVFEEEALNFMKKCNFFQHFECSAKTNQNVEEAFIALVPQIIKN